MKFIDNNNITDPTLNLAIEEYALKNLEQDETYLLFYVNEPSIIIGKNQNTIEEINLDYVKKEDLHVVRRLSGGGAVYHDLGNLNFSFITKDDGNSFHDFRTFTKPVVEALNRLGVEAELSGRNDIEVHGRKISGNAMFSTNGRLFSHGTLLLDSDIENVVKALNVNQEKITSKGIKSIHSRVANINEFLEEPMSMTAFKQLLLESIFSDQDGIPTHALTETDWEHIHQLSKERYQNWDWNYGKSPKYDLEKSQRFDIGSIDVRLKIKKGVIEDCKIFGDFFGQRDVKDIESRLINTRYEEEALEEALSDVKVSDYFGNLSNDAFIAFLY